jgi:glyoxylase-like metal-dependent hydrolase (beta-lactamase superfamily II)
MENSTSTILFSNQPSRNSRSRATKLFPTLMGCTFGRIVMKLELVKSSGIAHQSYFLCDSEEAVVIDPRRDCLVYKDLATKNCAKINYVFETHRNEDYVIGSLELQNITSAEICQQGTVSNMANTP